MTGSWSGEMKKVWRRLSLVSADEGGSSWHRWAAGLAPEAKAAGSTTNSNLIGTDNPIHSPRIQVVAKLEPWFFPNKICLRRDPIHKVHMGQFLQGGKNGRLMSFFFLKYSLRVTKPDEIASFSQFSVVSHML